MVEAVSHKWRSSRWAVCAMLVVALQAGGVATGWAQPAGSGATQATPAAPTAGQAADEPDLSTQATDPTASLMSFNLVNGFKLSHHGLDESGYEFKFQPVVPFRVWGISNILRVGIPYQVDGPGDEGLKSVSIFNLFVLPQSWGRLAFGPVMSLAESASSAKSKFAIGPAVGFMKPISRRLNAGLFSQNLFAAHVGLTQIQPIVAYQLGHGWALSAGDLQFTYDWERDQWVLLPLGFQIGVVRPIAGQPLRFALNPQYNFKDIDGAEQFKLTFTVTILAPSR
jgi:hypothetical protein